jgi:site-specific DNA-methyltransferase (cytosine-N4-specific)
MIKVKLFQSHIITALKQIPDNSIDTIITSPPYWGLRKYPDSANIIWDGDSNCEHEFELETQKDPMDRGGSGIHDNPKKEFTGARCWEMKSVKSGFCKKCGAWFGQLGLEPTLELYIKHLLQITAELKRVLKPTGVMFWNQGDSYIGSLQGYGVKDPNYKPTGFQDARTQEQYVSHYQRPPLADYKKLPPKCMALQNYRLILKMIDEQGWILRNSIIWHKPNHLPESCKDRFSRAYEPIFMLVKSKKYFFNLDAVREPLKSFTEQRKHDMERIIKHGKFLNPVTLGYDSKFLKNPSALAGSFNYRVREAKKGHFGKIGVKASEEEMKKYDNQGKLTKHDIAVGRIGNFSYTDSLHEVPYNLLGKNPGDVWTINTEPFPEAHFATFPTELVRRCIKAGCPENGIVLDPFVGSGTTIKVAIEERRYCIGIDVVEDYCKMAIKRCNLVNNPFIEFEYIKL